MAKIVLRATKTAIKTGGAPGRPPAAPPPLVSAPRGPKKSPLPFLLVLIVAAAAGFGIWKVYEKRQAAKRRARVAVRPVEAAKPVEAPKTNAVVAVEEPPKPVEPPKPKEKTAAEIRAEELAAHEAALKQVAAARADGAKARRGFGGVRFGDVLDGAPVRWGAIRNGSSVADCGVTYAVYAKPLATTFRTFGKQPLVWVTPKTRRAYRIELDRPLKGEHEAETTNAVAALAKRFKREAFAVWPIKAGRPGAEYVFPFTNTTVSVGEYDGRLKLAFEHEGLREEAKAEADAVRRAKMADEADAKLLDSARYPLGAMGRYPKMRFKEETPRAFCGVTFGKGAPYNAVYNNTRNGAKGFFLDYAKARHRIFRGFAHGKAILDPYRGGVHTVELHSDGGAEGLDDRDYYQALRALLKDHYKSDAVEKKGESPYPEATYTIGDLAVTLAGDVRGGFILRAVHKPLADLATQEPKKRR